MFFLFTYKDGVIKYQKANTYILLKTSQQYHYVLKNKVTITKEAENKSQSKFLLGRGSSLQITKIYIPDTYTDSNQIGYAEIKDAKGRTGWLYLSGFMEEALFQTIPAWG